MYPKYRIFLSKSWARTEDSKIFTKSLNMAHKTFQCCYVLKFVFPGLMSNIKVMFDHRRSEWVKLGSKFVLLHHVTL